MKLERKTVILRGISPILGSTPNNKEIYEDHVATKARKAELDRAKADADLIREEGEKGITIFYRDDADNLTMKDYQVKGFLKEAGRVLASQMNLKSAQSKIDNFIFIEPTIIPFTRNGELIKAADDINQRPLRAQTAQGPRVALAYSEQVDAPWELHFDILLLENKKTAQSVALGWEQIETMFKYGQLKGLLQWRNGGYGRFEYEVKE